MRLCGARDAPVRQQGTGHDRHLDHRAAKKHGGVAWAKSETGVALWGRGSGARRRLRQGPPRSGSRQSPAGPGSRTKEAAVRRKDLWTGRRTYSDACCGAGGGRIDRRTRGGAGTPGVGDQSPQRGRVHHRGAGARERRAFDEGDLASDVGSAAEHGDGERLAGRLAEQPDRSSDQTGETSPARISSFSGAA